MSMRTRLLKKQSSLAILVEQERETCESASRPPSEVDESTEDDPREVEEELEEALVQEELNLADEDGLVDQDGDTDGEGGDTDVPISSDDENEPIGLAVAPTINKKSFSTYVREGKERAGEVDPPVRLSRRLMSMKRRGKLHPLADLTEEFEFYAGDFLTVRGEEDDFYVCRVLEDVPESATSFNVAWFNRVEENLYEVCNVFIVLSVQFFFLLVSLSITNRCYKLCTCLQQIDYHLLWFFSRSRNHPIAFQNVLFKARFTNRCDE